MPYFLKTKCLEWYSAAFSFSMLPKWYFILWLLCGFFSPNVLAQYPNRSSVKILSFSMTGFLAMKFGGKARYSSIFLMLKPCLDKAKISPAACIGVKSLTDWTCVQTLCKSWWKVPEYRMCSQMQRGIMRWRDTPWVFSRHKAIAGKNSWETGCLFSLFSGKEQVFSPLERPEEFVPCLWGVL